MIAGVLDSAMDPAKTAGIVLDAIRERLFYILPHPQEALTWPSSNWVDAGQLANGAWSRRRATATDDHFASRPRPTPAPTSWP